MLNYDRLFSLLALVALFLPGAVIAGAEVPASAPIGEEMILFQEIPSVYSASKFDQKITEAPSSVSIITSLEIKKNGYRTLADILKSVRSFYVTYDRNYSYVGVRGFGRPGDYNTRILLLVDGHKTNDNIYGQAVVGTEAILDVDLIDRVEVIRGPGSSLYGDNAIFAVVNVITKRGRDLKGAEVSAEVGSFNTYKGRLSYGNRSGNGVEAILSGSSHGSSGDRRYYSEFDPANPAADTRAANNGNADHADYDRSENLFAKIALADFTIAGAYSSRTKGIPTGAFGTDFNDPGNKTTDTHAYADLRYDHAVNQRLDIEARLYYDYFQYTGDYIYSAVLNKDWGYGEWWGSEIKMTAKLADVHRIIVGGEYVDNMRQDQKNFDTAPYSLFLDDERRSTVAAAYLQDEVTIFRNLILNAGVRYDHYDTFGGTTNPRLALIYTPYEKSTIKLLYGSAFRAPNVFELYYLSSTSQPNPGLRPEKIKTYELVYEQYFGDHLRFSAGGYYYRISDLINQTDAAPLLGTIYRNIDEVTAQGIELELDNKWESGVEGRFSLTEQRAEDKLTGQPLTNSPEQLAKLDLTVPIVDDTLFISVEEQYMSRRATSSGAYAPDFFLTNITLCDRLLRERTSLSLSIYNLFDKRYGDPVSGDLVQHTVQQDGRSVRMKVSYAF